MDQQKAKHTNKVKIPIPKASGKRNPVKKVVHHKSSIKLRTMGSSAKLKSLNEEAALANYRSKNPAKVNPNKSVKKFVGMSTSGKAPKVQLATRCVEAAPAAAEAEMSTEGSSD